MVQSAPLRLNRGETFDAIAELYDRARPGYPRELADDVLAFASAGASDAPVLELGPGTGQATALFAARGLTIDAVEPGANLARIARERLAGFPRVRVIESSFEAFEPERRYGLVIAAQSFHWIEPGVRFEKTADLLVPRGALALFWHAPQPIQGAIGDAIQAVYRGVVPDLAVRPADGQWATQVADDVDASGRFGSVHAVRYRWGREYGAREYTDLLETQSDHRVLEDARRAELLGGIREAVEAGGGSVRVEYVLRLYLARRRDGAVRRVELRDVRDEDLSMFFEFENDSEAVWMAAFTAKDPADRAAFDAHWAKIRSKADVVVRTVLADGEVAGSVASYLNEGMPEVTYWIGRAFWGRGVASSALAALLTELPRRPVRARVAHDNLASRRVLEKCGFKVLRREMGFASARGAEIEELVLALE